VGLVVVSICFFAFTGAGQLLGYTRAFRAAVICDIGLALATLACSRFLTGRLPAGAPGAADAHDDDVLLVAE
jgi:hypothetical protein